LANQERFSYCSSKQRWFDNDSIILSSSASDSTDASATHFSDADLNKAYIQGLLQNLSSVLDRWIVSGTLTSRKRAHKIIQQIERESIDQELVKQAVRMASRAGCKPLERSEIDVDSKESMKSRLSLAEERKEWETGRMKMEDNTISTTSNISNKLKQNLQDSRSALSSRSANNLKSDIMMPELEKSLDPFQFANDKEELQSKLPLSVEESKFSTSVQVNTKNRKYSSVSTIDSSNFLKNQMDLAEVKASSLVAKAGYGEAFNGEKLGIGGLNDVLGQIRRRVWVPLATPSTLLKELGINPVRGLLLYGGPGCGKTLLARSIGKILSPVRPLTVVSGPEVMDRFVGSSEANLREIFDNPPEIYDTFRIGEKDDGKMLSKASLHVIIFDEFDAMARARGGRSGSGDDQGDAGVARDSVVNQLLAKMDGVDPLKVPTLVIGLTNKRNLIEPALLRPGRFEVQIEVRKPRTIAQRVSILNVHMKTMFQAGRVHVSDSPEKSASARRLKVCSIFNSCFFTLFFILKLKQFKLIFVAIYSWKVHMIFQPMMSS